MIKKLLNSEYLTGIERMTKEERTAYLNRVGQWLHSDGIRLLELTDRPMAKSQNIMLLSARWSKEDSDAVHEGVRLMSALVDVADTWLPSVLWTKSGWRAIRQIVNILSDTKEGKKKDVPSSGTQTTNVGQKPEADDRRKYTASKEQLDMQVKKEAVTMTSVAKPQGTIPMQLGIPVRPRHIDQYAHLLPKKTQERAAQYGPLMREMDEARENLRLLMKDPEANAASRESWAKKVTKIDDTLRSIRHELDVEWEHLVEKGKVVVDDLGQAHIVDVEKESAPEPEDVTQEPKKAGRKPMTEEEKAAKAAEREEKKKQEKIHQAALIRKWLIDTRNANTDEQKEKWIQKYHEMVAIGGEQSVTKKVLKAAAYYGINLEEEKK